MCDVELPESQLHLRVTYDLSDGETEDIDFIMRIVEQDATPIDEIEDLEASSSQPQDNVSELDKSRESFAFEIIVFHKSLINPLDSSWLTDLPMGKQYSFEELPGFFTTLCKDPISLL